MTHPEERREEGRGRGEETREDRRGEARRGEEMRGEERGGEGEEEDGLCHSKQEPTNFEWWELFCRSRQQEEGGGGGEGRADGRTD